MRELSLEERKKVMVEILSDIDEFCRENQIPYTLYCGTLLGAVRHGGFIPWDDDLDIAMLREDFERFVKTYKNRRYRMAYHPKDDYKFVVCGYAKVCDPDTIVDNGWSDSNHGIYVDVFPLDSVPEEKKEREKYMHKLMRYNNRMYHRGKHDLFSILKAHRHSMEGWWKKYEDLIGENRYGQSKYVAHIMGCHNFHEIFEKKNFQNPIEIEFEGKKFKSMEDPHAGLRIMYGDDYMTPPPPEKRITHNERAYKINE